MEGSSEGTGSNATVSVLCGSTFSELWVLLPTSLVLRTGGCWVVVVCLALASMRLIAKSSGVAVLVLVINGGDGPMIGSAMCIVWLAMVAWQTEVTLVGVDRVKGQKLTSGGAQ